MGGLQHIQSSIFMILACLGDSGDESGLQEQSAAYEGAPPLYPSLHCSRWPGQQHNAPAVHSVQGSNTILSPV
jgi:hypothetical protein